MKLFLTDFLINSTEELLVIVCKLKDEHKEGRACRESRYGREGDVLRDLCSYRPRKSEEGKDHKHLFFFLARETPLL